MSQIISRSDTFTEGWNVYGTILNAKNVLENDRPKTEIKAVLPEIIDNNQDLIVITGKNFYNNMNIKFINNQFSGTVPHEIVDVHNNVASFYASAWTNLKSSTEKYKITIDSETSSNIKNAPMIEIKNIIKKSELASTTSQNAATKETTILSTPKDINNTVLIDKKFSEKLKGKILLQIESHGEAWYVNPPDNKRYYMADGNAAYAIMRNLSVGINNKNFDNILKSKTLAKKYSGKIFIKTEDLGKAYYVDFSGNLYYLKDGGEAYNLMRKLGLGIKNNDLNKIEIGQ